MADDSNRLAAIRSVRADAMEVLRVFRGMRASTDANGPAKVVLTAPEMYFLLDSATSVIERYIGIVDAETAPAESHDEADSSII